MAQLKSRCSLCKGRGKLWLAGRDYLECPDCNGTGMVTYDETKVRQTERTIFVAGCQPVKMLTNRIVRTTIF